MAMAAESTFADGADLWMPDPKVEALLARLGVPWEIVTVNSNLIDDKASARNQARLNDVLDQERVEEYTEAMRRGDVFPALVAHALGDGQFLLHGGNHRLAAAKRARRTSIMLYLIRTNDAGMRHLVTVLLNTLEGVRPPRADLIRQCLYAVDHFAYDLTQAAAQFGLPVSAVQTERRRTVTRGRLVAVGAKVDAVPVRIMDAMHSIPNDVALREVAEIVVAASLPETEARDLIVQMREQRTEAGAKAIGQQWRDRDDVKLRQAGLVKRRSSTPPSLKHRLMGMLGGARSMLEKHKTRAALGLTNDDDMNRAVEAAYGLVEQLEHVRNATA